MRLVRLGVDCTNWPSLPEQVNGSNSRWSHKKSFTVKGFSEFMNKKIESLEIEIKKLKAYP